MSSAFHDIVFNGERISPEETLRELDRVDCEDSLYTFLEYAWRYIDPSPFTPGWPLEAIADHLQAVVDGDIKKLCINIPPRMGKSTICSVAFPAWVWAQRYDSPTSGPTVPLLHASYALSLAMRDSVKCRRLIESPWYRTLWGDRFTLVGDQNTKGRFQNSQRGERLITAVDARVTGEGGNIVVVDDPNAANEALSRAMIEACTEWWDGTMSTRLNDSKNGAFIVIQQRLGEQDLTGHILETDTGWTHLCLPMRYEPERSFTSSIGWEDPRAVPGELLWPDRFDDAQVTTLEKRLGPWKCNPGEAPILMADLSMKRLDQVRAGDEVVGFSKNALAQDAAFSRHSLTPATVTEVHQYVADIVEITLDGGRKIRCTPDHKWFTKDRGPSREMYMPATLRSSLARVCDPELPVLSDEDLRDAGWLSGFFDGEGSVTQQRRKNASDKTGHTICFYQGAGRNLPLCEKLERLLTKFGFEWSYTEDERKPNKDAPCYGYRTYRIKGGGLPVLQRFLHIVQPTKWRDRIISAAYRANFIQQRERVVSIVPAGRATVYGLTTTTGNYVVWGLASSNSAGQLQQRPEPAGGGIIKREWWEAWPDAAYPLMDFVVASLDTAYTTKTENDYSALTVWGVFSGDVVAQATKQIARDGEVTETTPREYGQQHARVMLMHAWQERLELHDLVKKVAETCKAMKVDKLLVEDKAAGHSVAQEIRRLYSHEDFAVQLINPGAFDKMARLYSIQHLFAEGLIYAPDRSWADQVITQCGTFPKAVHDDLCFVGDTMIALASGEERRIDQLRVGDIVETPIGPSRVAAVACTGEHEIWRMQHQRGELLGTRNHPVWTNNEWKPLESLRPNDMLETLCSGKDVSWCSSLLKPLKSKALSSMAANTIAILNPVTKRTGVILHGLALACTATFGSFTKAPSRKAGKCITSMATRATIPLRTWNACRVANTGSATTLTMFSVENPSSNASILLGSEQKLRSGTAAKRAARGIVKTHTHQFAQKERQSPIAKVGTTKIVFGAVKRLLQRATRPFFAPRGAMRNGHASSAVLSVSATHTTQRVYNLTVERAHCYYANGVLVHNCDTVSMALRHLRDLGLLVRSAEHMAEMQDNMRHRGGPLKPLYDI